MRRSEEDEEGKMEAALEHGRWDELLPEALALIFSKVSIPERVSVIPCVCKSWSRAVTEPICWQEIDLFPWTENGSFHLHQLETTLHMLLPRSSGSLHTLTFYGLHSDSIFPLIARHGGCLRTLRIPESKISDSIMEHIAGRLSLVTFLDVSHCANIGARGLELIGNNCKLLEKLYRRMYGCYTENEPPRDDEAMAIASTMPNLKHLDILGHSMTTEGVRKILAACSN